MLHQEAQECQHSQSSCSIQTDSQSQPEIETLETEKKMILLKLKRIVEGPRIEI
jgi:hypothetical protein